MPDPSDSAAPQESSRLVLLRRAKRGDRDALGALLDQHRAYLKLLSRRVLDQRLAVRADESDMVQQSLLIAVRQFPEFRGDHPDQLAAWLREIHEGQLANLVRDNVGAQKRSLNRESPVDAARDVTASQTTPSQRLFRGEAAVALAAAIDQLPTDQGEAVRLRFIEGLPLQELCRRFDRSPEAVAGLVKRGLQGLRQALTPDYP